MDPVHFEGTSSLLPPVLPVEIVISNLSVATTKRRTDYPNKVLNHQAQSPPRTKQLLQKINAQIPSGSVTAIIGGSGSGKTTLLDCITGYLSAKQLQVEGSVSFRGELRGATFRAGYTTQYEALLPTLTVRETLTFAADLRLPLPDPHERAAIVEQVIHDLGLSQCAETKIGTMSGKGCSGGEKRRVNVGIRILANPSCILCDEPTTGLDSASAYRVIRVLKQLAQQGRTVVLSIHSPRREICDLFDQVLLLSDGCLLYGGPLRQVSAHFGSCGFPMASTSNPVDFMIKLSATNATTAEKNASAKETVRYLKECWEISHLCSHVPNPFTSEVSIRNNLSFPRKLKALTMRTIKTTCREPLGVAAVLLMSVTLALFTGLTFYQVDESLQGIRSRESGLFVASQLYGYLVLLFEIYRLSLDVQVYDQERLEGAVDTLTFLISRRAAKLLLEDIPSPLFFSSIFYFMVGFHKETGEFLIFVCLITITNYITIAVATICVGISRNFATASLIGNIFFTFQSMACGYFLPVRRIPAYVAWTKWVTPNFYLFGALCSNEFIGLNRHSAQGRVYGCPYSHDPFNTACQEYTGKYVMRALGNTQVAELSPQMTVQLHSFGLELVRKRSPRNLWYRRNLERRHVIQSLNVQYMSNELNIVMGPSGSGKSTLLNVIAGRSPTPSWTTAYRTYGEVLYGGKNLLPREIRTISCYVPQDDNSLLATLTVRETLAFAAALRLPKLAPAGGKVQEVEQLIQSMGLAHCSDTVVGSVRLKGISQGERRRLSIAIQLLTDPEVLVLDEPTSGLDSFTTFSIIRMLQEYASKGRTVILSIHQPQQELFEHFTYLMLLSSDGHMICAGRSSSILARIQDSARQIFEQGINPADFIMDLAVHGDLTNSTEFSRENLFISGWDTFSEDFGTGSQANVSNDIGNVGFRRGRQTSPFYAVLHIFLRRAALNLWRQPFLMAIRITQTIGVGIVLSLFFGRLQHGMQDFQTSLGLIQQFGALYYAGRETILLDVKQSVRYGSSGTTDTPNT
ncbi:ABC-2 type transporter [Penicillium longicatenatum]|uniref:ABC-2 type transporter n=1 Tax=Penicillium longicatenatum TaxID=1561947 RepID=UPI002546648A|nr:ABC-2 type transporter [Penicillium longicatenatum]KAJ5644238.1 ABC-2 type transporter [Penicillium longicatenatum]